MLRGHRTALLLALILISGHLGVTAQEERDKENPIYKPDSELSPEERIEKQELIDAVMKGKPTRADNAARELRFPTRLEDLQKDRPLRPSTWDGPLPPATYVTFGPRDIQIDSSHTRYSYPATIKRGDPDLRRWLDRGDVFVLKGDVTQEDEDRFKELGQVVTVSGSSPKRSYEEAVRAATIALRPFKAEQAVVMSALPYERDAERGREELARMGLHGTSDGWRSAGREIRKTAEEGRIPVRIATKKAVLKEFQEGENDVLFLVAHSDSNSILLPGVAGGRITVRDLDSIKRESAPDRAIVLLACKTRAVKGQSPSLAETLIKNRLASIVFASDEFVYTKDVSAMLRNLHQSGTLGQAFESMGAIVHVDEPYIPWNPAEPTEALLIVAGDGRAER
jgi:hypothetical protein